MKTLLRIDASARIPGSHTREVTDYFESKWQELNPEGRILRRDLARDPIPHLSGEAIKAFQEPAGLKPTLSDILARELASVDALLIASPIYNLSLPSALKAYIDHVVRSGITFEARGDGSRGLLKGISATLITARGSAGSTGDAGDFQTGYLKAILAFIGIETLDVIAMDGMAGGKRAQEEGLARAKRQADQHFGDKVSPSWEGHFEEDDKRAISALREAQATAIVQGDAEAYANLCTEDIQLLIPGEEMISGRAAFLEAERALFARASFSAFDKYPLRVEGSGDLAVEIGHQEAASELTGKVGGVYSARQKYTHLFRRTEAGWRFAVLMSNPSE